MDYQAAQQRLLVDAVRVGDCLEWQRGHDRDGYGFVTFEGERYGAHRLAWIASNERLLLPGEVVRHTCDNPPCIDGTHLVVGTVLDNNRDRNLRGRTAWGERQHSAKITSAQAREIRTRAQAGESPSALGREFGITPKAIRCIRANITWRKA